MTTPPPARRDVAFSSSGSACAAWLYLPEGSEPAPVIVMAHGLGAVRDMGLDDYAERFCAAGYACLVFDYRHFGSSEGEPRQLLDIGLQLEDWRAALTYVRALPAVDGTRAIAWGTSFGGGHAIVVAGEDRALAAAIAQCPFTDGIASLRAMNPAAAARVTKLALQDELGSRIGRPPRTVATAGTPGSTALMTAPDVVPGYLGLVREGMPFLNRVAARIGLAVGFHRPGLRLADAEAPVLLCVCERDSVAPPEATLRHAKRGKRTEVRTYDEGHFDIYSGPAFERVVADQLAFLARHVPVDADRASRGD